MPEQFPNLENTPQLENQSERRVKEAAEILKTIFTKEGRLRDAEVVQKAIIEHIERLVKKYPDLFKSIPNAKGPRIEFGKSSDGIHEINGKKEKTTDKYFIQLAEEGNFDKAQLGVEVRDSKYEHVSDIFLNKDMSRGEIKRHINGAIKAARTALGKAQWDKADMEYIESLRRKSFPDFED